MLLELGCVFTDSVFQYWSFLFKRLLLSFFAFAAFFCFFFAFSAANFVAFCTSSRSLLFFDLQTVSVRSIPSIRSKVVQEHHVLDTAAPKKVTEFHLIPWGGQWNRNFRIRHTSNRRVGKGETSSIRWRGITGTRCQIRFARLTQRSAPRRNPPVSHRLRYLPLGCRRDSSTSGWVCIVRHIKFPSVFWPQGYDSRRFFNAWKIKSLQLSHSINIGAGCVFKQEDSALPNRIRRGTILTKCSATVASICTCFKLPGHTDLTRIKSLRNFRSPSHLNFHPLLPQSSHRALSPLSQTSISLSQPMALS